MSKKEKAQLKLPNILPPTPWEKAHEELERKLIGDALNLSLGNRAQAARALGISYPTLRNRVRKFARFDAVGIL